LSNFNGLRININAKDIIQKNISFLMKAQPPSSVRQGDAAVALGAVCIQIVPCG